MHVLYVTSQTENCSTSNGHVVAHFQLTGPITSLNFTRLLRVIITPSVTSGENDSKQSDEFQARAITWFFNPASIWKLVIKNS